MFRGRRTVRGKRAKRRTASFARLGFEQLEYRTLLSVSPPHVIAELRGSVGQVQQVSLVQDDFTLRTGKVVLGFLVEGSEGSSLDPSPLALHDAGGAILPPLVAVNDVDSTSSIALFELPLGSYIAMVDAENGTIGSYQATVFLVGDLDGDGDADMTDGSALRGLLGTVDGDGRYRAEADINLDARITSLDYAYWRRNLDNSTRLQPLGLNVQFSPAVSQRPDGKLKADDEILQLSGSTRPFAVVDVDVNGDGIPEDASAADAAGVYVLDVTLSEGENALHVRALDSFGQLRSEDFTLLFEPNHPPILNPLPNHTQLRNEGAFDVEIPAFDVDGDEVTLIATSSDSQVAVAIIDGVLRITPADGFAGKATIAVSVSDGVDQRDQSFDVFVGDPPSPGAPLTIDAIEDQEIHVGDESRTIPLTIRSSNPNAAISVETSYNSEQIQVDLVNGNLILRPVGKYVGSTTVGLAVSELTASSNIVIDEFEVVVRGSTSELVNGVLVIHVTGQKDKIRVVPGAVVTVYDGNTIVSVHDETSVHRIEVDAGAEDDSVDLRSVGVDTWVYGGPGNDTLLGGHATDSLFGMDGGDTIKGGAGPDILYGGEGQFNADGSLVEVNEHKVSVDGEAGADYISLGTGVESIALPAGDVDIEGLAYEDRVYFDLLHRFRDAHGFIVVHDMDGNANYGPDERGDAMIFTGLAVTAAALRGESADALSLLQTLRDKPFVNELGRTRLVRHPEVWDYTKEVGGVFVRDRHQPVTKDGVVGVMTAAYYAYTAPGMSDDVRRVAKEVVEKYVDYLIANQWKTLDHYPDHYWAKDSQDSKKFAHVFSNSDGGPTSWKGPEGYMLSPADRYALQNVAAKMGFLTSHWQVWAEFGAALVQTIGDGYQQIVEAVGDGVASALGDKIDKLLQAIRVHEEYSFHVVPGLDWTLVEGSLDLEISAADRDNIVSAITDFVRTTIRVSLLEFFDPAINDVSEVPSFIFQLNDLAGRLVDKIVGVLPSWVGTDRWISVVTSTLQQVMPWLNGQVLGELTAFRLSHELAKTDEIVAHLSFWPTLLMFETRPEMVDLLGWSVDDLDTYLGTD